MNILKGKAVADSMAVTMQTALKQLPVTPCLAIIRVGKRPDDLAYERGARKRMEKIGIHCQVVALPETISEEEFLKQFRHINQNPDVHGILIFRPLPEHLRRCGVEQIIDPLKDVDAISPQNTARVYLDDKRGFAPCTAEAVLEIIDSIHYDVRGKKVVVVGCGNVVGKPLSVLLFNRMATVTVCNEFTQDLKNECATADVLVSCAGVRRLIKGDYVPDGCIVIDVGINTDDDGNLCGDVDFDAAAPHASYITPVPGGVGGVTTSVLAKHVIKAAVLQQERQDSFENQMGAH